MEPIGKCRLLFGYCLAPTKLIRVPNRPSLEVYVSPSPVLFFFVAPPSTHVLPSQLALHFEGVKTLRLLIIQRDEENGSRLKHAGQSAWFPRGYLSFLRRLTQTTGTVPQRVQARCRWRRWWVLGGMGMDRVPTSLISLQVSANPPSQFSSFKVISWTSTILQLKVRAFLISNLH